MASPLIPLGGTARQVWMCTWLPGRLFRPSVAARYGVVGMALSFARQSFKSCCTLLEYGTEGGGSLNAGSRGGAGHVLLGGGEIDAQPIKLSASPVSSSAGSLFAAFRFIDGLQYVNVLAALGRTGLLFTLGLQAQALGICCAPPPGLHLPPATKPYGEGDCGDGDVGVKHRKVQVSPASSVVAMGSGVYSAPRGCVHS